MLRRVRKEPSCARWRRRAGRAGPVVAGTYNSRVAAFAGLPGADLVEDGLADLETGRETEAALLVSIGAPKLTQLGITLPRAIPDPEHRLYALLSERDADGAHARYNALIRRLVSFERALACAR